MKAITKVISSSIQVKNVTDKNIRVAVIAHLYYENTFQEAISYLMSVPEYADIYITTGSEEKKGLIEKICIEMGTNVAEIRVVKNRGRDVSALLVGCRDVWDNYEYLCFVHDKATSADNASKKVGHTYMYLLWENMLKSRVYVENVLKYMEQNPFIGLLVPPAPYHGNYFGNYGDEWTICYEKTVHLAKTLGISADIPEEEPPIALGTAFWCRTDALKPLWSAGFSYDSFDPEPMAEDNTISHAIERVLPYVAEAQHYQTEIIMNDQYASMELVNYHFMLNNLVSHISEQTYFVSYRDLIHHINYFDYSGIKGFSHKYECIYIYGTGNTAYETTLYLKKQNIQFGGYIVSDNYKKTDCFMEKPVWRISDMKPDSHMGIIVAVNNSNSIQVVMDLKKRGFSELYFNKEIEPLLSTVDGVKYVDISYSEDIRGISRCIFKDKELEGFESSEIFVSTSGQNVIRGMHFQPSPYGQTKLITVIEGKIEGVVLDLRPLSRTYLAYEKIDLSENCGKSLIVPEYCAWGFQTFAEKNTVIYNISGEYKKDFDRGIRWDSFGYDWKAVNPIMSDRDKNLITLEAYLKENSIDEKNKM